MDRIVRKWYHYTPNSKLIKGNIVPITIDLFYFREIDHPNVLKLLGQCTEAPPLLAIVEYASLVSSFYMKNHLKKWCSCSDSQYSFVYCFSVKCTHLFWSPSKNIYLFLNNSKSTVPLPINQIKLVRCLLDLVFGNVLTSIDILFGSC